MKDPTIKTVIDIGSYDGADTAYFLECGFHVVAVEANRELADSMRRRFQAQIASGQLTCINAAISPNGETVELVISGIDLGSSSIFVDRIAERGRIGKMTVAGVTLQQLFEKYGVPDYLKVDIEGADRLCVLSLTAETRPTFLSFEVGDDVDELLAHLSTIGFRRFKIINQHSFRELAEQQCYWFERGSHWLMRCLGYQGPLKVRRAGRFFVIERSSGTPPWKSDGLWRSVEETRVRLREAKASGALRYWYDIHATTDW